MKAFERKWRQHIDNLQASPFFRCRDQLRFLGYATRLLRTKLKVGYSFERLRREVTSPRRVWSWGAQGKTEPVDIADALFSCPCQEQDLHDKAYTLIWKPGAQMPQFECRRCPGHKLTLSFHIDDETGEYRIQLNDFLRDGAGQPGIGRRRSFDRDQQQ